MASPDQPAARRHVATVLVRAAALGLMALAVWSSAAFTQRPSPATRAIRYPGARTVDVVDDYFGTRVADPYRWFESDTPETRQWAARQARFTTPYLRNREMRPWVESRIREYNKPFQELDSAEAEDRRAQPIRLERATRGTHDVLVAQAGPTKPRRVLFDPVRYGSRARIARFRVSRDQQHVIVEWADGGSDWKQARVLRVADGFVLPETVDGLLFSQPVWTRDSKGFFYVRYQRPAPDTRVMFQDGAVFYHALGSTRGDDRQIFESAPGNSEIVVGVSLSSDGRYAFIAEGSGADSDEIGWFDSRLHVLDLGNPDAPKLTAPLMPLSASRDAAYRVIRSSGTELTVLTDRGAPRHRLVTIDLADPAPERWRDLIPESAAMLQSVRVISGRLVAIYLRDAQSLVRVFTLDGALVRQIEPPPMSHVFVEPGSADSLLEIESESYLQPPVVVQHDLTTGRSTPLHATAAGFPVSKYVQRQRWYVSKDGTRIPIFLVHRKDIVLDARNPTLLFGYGASGTSMSPSFDPEVLAWLELGGVYAMPSLRGGGEFGRAWYAAATLGRKQTTFDDFIAAAEFLIAERYTSPARLAIKGASNGGLLVSAVMTQRPELFAVAVADVPQTDNLRYDRGRHRGQFGAVTDSTQFSFLYAYSPLHRVRQGTCYPATLIRTALNDDRSPAWGAMKFAASLQSAQACNRPILLQAQPFGGHYAQRSPESAISDATDVMVFIATQLDVRVPRRP